MNNLFADDLMELLETMSNELPAGEIHRLILYPDGSGLVESEGYEQFDFANIPDLLDRYECQRCGTGGGPERRFWVSFTVSFVVIVIVLHYWPHVIGVLNGG